MKITPSFNPRTCVRKAWRAATSLLLSGAGALIVFGLAAQSAWAHFPRVAAYATCDSGTINIHYTITSWETGSTGGSGEDSNVAVFFNDGQKPVGSGSFVDPLDSFSGMAAAPLGASTVLVSAVPEVAWGDGYAGGAASSSDTWGTSALVDLSTVSPCAPPADVRFTGGGKVVVSNAIVPAGGSVTVTKGFEVECDLDPAHENLELNWNGGAHFHMDMITGATCSEQGTPPNPPQAPANRIDGTGTGSYNGNPGYTVVFTLWDQGEPGGSIDEAGFVVCLTDPSNPNSCATSTSIVLSVPLQVTTTGNIQAHIDTGH